VDGSWKCKRKCVCSGIASALSVRSGAVSLDTECGIPCKNCWPNFQVEEAVSTLKSQEQVWHNCNESLGLAG
jgi:hypothetical protein